MDPIKDKNFLGFFGKPLIEHQLGILRKAGFADIVVVYGAHNKEALSALKKVKCVEQKDLDAGMKGAVLAARECVEENEPVLIVSSNDVVDVEAFELINEHSQSAPEVDGFMVAKKVSEYFPGGYVAFDGDHILQQIVEKPGPGNEPSSLVNIVIHLWKNPSELFAFLEKFENGNDDAYELAISEMIKNDRKIKVLEYKGPWQPIKYPWHILDVWKTLFGNTEIMIKKSAEIAESATIKGNVVIEDGVRVFENAVINGPCYIGKNTVIANNALVRDSHIGENCVIGFSTEVARSYLADHVWTHSNYIGDSVILDNVSFGAGCVTGNLRLDDLDVSVNIKGEKISSGKNKLGLICGENVRVGVNTSFMPGVKIGNNSFVGAGIFLNEDVPDGKYVYGKWDLQMRDNNKSASLEERKKMRDKL